MMVSVQGKHQCFNQVVIRYIKLVIILLVFYIHVKEVSIDPVRLEQSRWNAASTTYLQQNAAIKPCPQCRRVIFKDGKTLLCLLILSIVLFLITAIIFNIALFNRYDSEYLLSNCNSSAIVKVISSYNLVCG